MGGKLSPYLADIYCDMLEQEVFTVVIKTTEVESRKAFLAKLILKKYQHFKNISNLIEFKN